MESLPDRWPFELPDTFEERHRVPNEVFETQYRGYGLAELAAAKGIVETEYSPAADAAAEDRYAAGLYEEFVVAPPTDPEEGPELPPWPYSKGLIRSQRTEVLDDGRLRVKRTVLPYAEHPGLYAQQDELNWLNVRIHNLREEEAGAKR